MQGKHSDDDVETKWETPSFWLAHSLPREAGHKKRTSDSEGSRCLRCLPSLVSTRLISGVVHFLATRLRDSSPVSRHNSSTTTATHSRGKSRRTLARVRVQHVINVTSLDAVCSAVVRWSSDNPARAHRPRNSYYPLMRICSPVHVSLKSLTSHEP